jgi:hypothetical protein
MTVPYQPTPGCTARQQQLEEQVRQLTADRASLEDELGEVRQRLNNLRRQVRELANEREAELTEVRDLLEPWGGHGDGWPSVGPAVLTLIEKLNGALQRAATAEAERDQFAAGMPMVCSDGRHAAKVRGLEQILTAGQKATEYWEGAYTREIAAHGLTEGALSRVRAECERIVAEVYGQHDEDDDSMREAVRRVTAAADGTLCQCRPLDGCDCGMTSVTEKVRGGRRLRQRATPGSATTEARP